MPENWREHLAAVIKEHHEARYARGETPYRVAVTSDRAIYERSQEERGYSALPAASPALPRTAAREVAEPLPGAAEFADLAEATKAKIEVQPLRVRLHVTRKKRGLSQARVGKIFGVSQMTISNWELGIVPDDQGRIRGKPIPGEMAPLLERWVATGEGPSPDALASRTTRRSGKRRAKTRKRRG